MGIIVGSAPSIEADFTLDGVLVDPSTVQLRVQRPNGTIDTYTYAAVQIDKISTGKYRKTYSVAAAGVYLYSWTTTGPSIVEEGSFFVEAASF